jgi:hypothetical protein
MPLKRATEFEDRSYDGGRWRGGSLLLEEAVQMKLRCTVCNALNTYSN